MTALKVCSAMSGVMWSSSSSRKRDLGAVWLVALVEHAADMRGKRHVADQEPRENALALVGFLVGEALAGLGELDVAAFHFGQSAAAATFRPPGTVRPLPSAVRRRSPAGRPCRCRAVRHSSSISPADQSDRNLAAGSCRVRVPGMRSSLGASLSARRAVIST